MNLQIVWKDGFESSCRDIMRMSIENENLICAVSDVGYDAYIPLYGVRYMQFYSEAITDADPLDVADLLDVAKEIRASGRTAVYD